MADFKIPDEVVEAAAAAYWNTAGSPDWTQVQWATRHIVLKNTRAAIAAALAAWPGGSGELSDKGRPHIILPLPEEPRT